MTIHPHRRLNILTGEWVLVSPHRTQRPWQGQVERVPTPVAIDHDPACYLCPGNSRAGGVRNPAYTSTFTFDNDFAALKMDVPDDQSKLSDLLVWRNEHGVCRVVCFSPNHGLTIARMQEGDIVKVVDTWTEQFIELSSRREISYVQIFENRGEMMGASNPHPHCQIWASESLPNEPAKENTAQREYSRSHGRCLLCDYVALELKQQERILFEESEFVALVPFWAVWPFETLIVSRRHWNALDQATDSERGSLARTLKRMTTRFENLFEAPFPYTMGFHQRPSDGGPYEHMHFHAHYYPPLLRSATVRKFMVGFEMLATPQRDITAESAAERLRGMSEVHYLERP
jgi:UDPglucose--hexose-1-phosphate uridylyltransferase